MIDLSDCKTSSEAAARWWAAKARNPGFWSNGDYSERGIIAAAMCTVVGNGMERSEDKLAKFESLLREKIDYILTAPEDAKVYRYRSIPVVDHPRLPRGCSDEEYDAWHASYDPAYAAACAALAIRGILYSVRLDVDYHPDRVLGEALREADLDKLNGLGGMPAKTGMRVQFDSVEVSVGYGSGWDTIWGPTGLTYDLQGNVINE